MKNLSKFIVLGAIVLSGCATNDYQLYAEAQKSIAQSRALAEAAKYTAFAEIAKSGDSAAKVAAVISMNMAGSQVQNGQTIAAPKSVADSALQWASLILPSITQIYGINKNSDVSINQSNNTALVAKSTNEAFVGIAGKIQAPQANVTTNNITRDSNNTTTTTTTSTTIGRDNNTGSNSGNAGRIAGGDQTDNTATPTIVKPEVVNTSTTNTTTTTNNSNNTTGATGNTP